MRATQLETTQDLVYTMHRLKILHGMGQFLRSKSSRLDALKHAQRAAVALLAISYVLCRRV